MGCYNLDVPYSQLPRPLYEGLLQSNSYDLHVQYTVGAE